MNVSPFEKNAWKVARTLHTFIIIETRVNLGLLIIFALGLFHLKNTSANWFDNIMINHHQNLSFCP